MEEARNNVPFFFYCYDWLHPDPSSVYFNCSPLQRFPLSVWLNGPPFIPDFNYPKSQLEPYNL